MERFSDLAARRKLDIVFAKGKGGVGNPRNPSPKNEISE